jgi:3-phenylpropionate/cinnamic acid dioxygenase small subunit
MLADLTAVRNLIATYAERLDGGDLDGFAALFEGARLRTDGNPAGYDGAAAVREMVRTFVLLYDGRPSTKHVTTDIGVRFDDADNATVRSSFSVFQCRPELPLQVVIAGRYVDRVQRGDRGWQFIERTIHADLVGDLRFHVPRLTPPRT